MCWICPIPKNVDDDDAADDGDRGFCTACYARVRDSEREGGGETMLGGKPTNKAQQKADSCGWENSERGRGTIEW